MEPSSSLLLRLPPELVVDTLRLLPDISSLRSTILSCRYLYHVFSENQSSIITDILSRLVSPELLPEAVAVSESSYHQQWTEDKVARVLTQYRDRRRITRLKVSLADALQIEQTHLCVCSFVDKFASAALSRHPFTERLETPAPLSSSEWRRVASSFYRAELCTNLFRPRRPQYSTGDDGEGSSYSRIPEITNVLLCYFPSWEIEQLGCVSEFVYRELWKYSKEDRETNWGRSTLEFTDVVIWEGQKRRFFSCGLRFLHHLFSLESAEERHSLLAPRFNCSRQALPNDTSHIHAEWDDSFHIDDLPLDSLELFNYDAADHAEDRSGSPLMKDIDLGPAAGFTWVSELLQRTDTVCTLSVYGCRARGYVMWDHTRLAAWGFFKDLWESMGVREN